VSNPIRYDPVIVRALADELRQRLAGRRCAALPSFLRERVVLLPLEGGAALRLDLHPTRGWIRLVDTPPEAEGAELSGTVLDVASPPDERRLSLKIDSGDRFSSVEREIIVELQGNQWNALVVDARERTILTVLWRRDAGGRTLAAGEAYAPPARPERFGTGDVDREEAQRRWLQRLAPLSADERAAVLVREFAWTGTLNARLLAGAAAADSPLPLEDAFEVWWRLRRLDTPQPVVLELDSGPQPYPTPLPGMRSRSVPSLLAAIEACTTQRQAARPASPDAEWLEPIRRAREAALRRADQIRRQLEAGPSSEELRLRGDLLLARLRLVPRGASSVRLANWDGSMLAIELDPTLSPSENASRWYGRARRRERAEQTLPALLESAQAEARRWDEALQAHERGEPLPAPVRDALADRGEAAGGGRGETGGPALLPYRRYRTSGGLEVRVGRNSRANDQLTFKHAAPNDVWLHARSVPGSHVILRWPDVDGAPPARDLAEAATLAALFSRARTSSLVAVDWTRRKHVRKPRGAPAGAVIPQRVRTVFVEPDAEVEAKLRAEPLS
jgi:predicted ribosome quality control (RQC) complex YloA/Tae2 family protein